MTYKLLLAQLHSIEPNPNYYHLLLANATIVLAEVAIRNQGQVAKDLRMSTSKLSNILSFLKEFAND